MRSIARHTGKALLALIALLFAASALLAVAAPAHAATSSGTQKVTIGDLITERYKLTGQSVQFEGEVVGAPLDADRGHTWVLVAEGGETVSVYMKDDDAAHLEHFGEYGTVGDTIRVTGIFHVECMTHDSDLDVHATEVKIIEPGGPVEEPASPEPLVPAIIVLVVGVVTGIVYWRLRERLR